MNRLFATTALVTALAMAPALAQQSGEQPQGTDEQLLQQQQTAPQDTAPQGSDTIIEQQPQDEAPQDQAAEQQPMESQEVQFIASQEKSDWLASSLIGRSVYNQQDENLGNINDVIVAEDGQVVGVLIGIGGFLGIGQKNVGVNFAALQFEEQREAAPADTGPAPAPMTGTEPPPAAGQAPSPMSGSDQQPAAAEEDAEHSNMIIVLNTTREQLEAAPAFVYLDEQGVSQAEPAPQPEAGAQPEEGAPAGQQEQRY